MKLNVEDYVRTKQGRIGKISNLTVDYSSELILCEENSILFAKHQIINSSPNIIDLIEVGDYVNGEKIIKITDDFAGRKILIWGFDDGKHQVTNAIYEDDIKTVVTKEQFEAMQYKVGD